MMDIVSILNNIYNFFRDIIEGIKSIFEFCQYALSSLSDGASSIFSIFGGVLGSSLLVVLTTIAAILVVCKFVGGGR